jgi:hypothetical protein
MRSPSDSDVRLEPDKKPSSAELPATEEHRLDLDTDLAKAEKSAKSSTLRAKKPKAKSPPTPPSPFELSDSDLELGKGGSGSSSPAGDSDVISIGEVSRHGDLVDATNSSGVNLHAPADSGINLEKEKDANPSSSSEIEFELSLEGDSTPDPASGSPQQGSSSSVADLDLESSSSSSEFELTLDDSGGLAPLEEDKESPSASGEKDIFETDLEVPALDEESASEVVPLDDADTDLESSDFDFDPVESESGSQVVAVDEDIDDAAATVQRKGKSKGRAAALAAGAAAGAAAAAAGEEELDEVDAMLASGEEAAVEDESESVLGRTTAPIAPAAPANWGWVPAAVLIPCVIVMFVLTLMTFELLHSMWGYRQPSGASGVLIRPISSMFGAELPPE